MMQQNRLIIVTPGTSPGKPQPPLSLQAVFAARTLLLLCKPHTDGSALAIADGIKSMDGDPGLPEISRRLPAATNNNNPEARAIVTRLVEDIAQAARDMLQHYGQQNPDKPQLMRLQDAARQTPRAAEILSGILAPEFKANAAELAQAAPQDIRAIRALRYIARPLQI